jgi:hypothetical protein
LIAPGTGWDFSDALAINDAGQIVGQGKIDGQYRAFVLTPVPEPSTLVMLLVAGLAAAVSAWRRVASCMSLKKAAFDGRARPG